jgi:hypothetical protein
MIFLHQERSHRPATPSPLSIRLSKIFPLRRPRQIPNRTAIPPGANGRQGVNLTSSTIYQAAKMKIFPSNSRALSKDVSLVLPSQDILPSLSRHQVNGPRFRSSSLHPLRSRRHTKYSYHQPCLPTSRTVAFAFRARLPHHPWMGA